MGGIPTVLQPRVALWAVVEPPSPKPLQGKSGAPKTRNRLCQHHPPSQQHVTIAVSPACVGLLPSHPATSSDLLYCNVITCPYCHATSIHDDVTLLTSSCHVIHRTSPTMLTSSSFLAREAKIVLRKPGSKF